MLRSARGSLQVLAPSDQCLQSLRRCDPTYVRSHPVPQFVGFLRIFFSFMPGRYRTLSCDVLLLMQRLHMLVLRIFVTCEDSRLKSAPNIIFDVLKDFPPGFWDALMHLSTSPVPRLGTNWVQQLIMRYLTSCGTS